MPRYEVHIPGAEPGKLALTFRVEAPNWMQALKTGFHKLGETGLVVHNVLVDVVEDGSLHVTEAGSGRVFRIRELAEQEAASARLKPSSAPTPDPSSAQTVVGGPALRVASAPTSPAPAGALEATQLARPAPAPDRPVGRTVTRPTPLSTPALTLPVSQELVEPTRPVRGPIGRPRPPPPPREIEDVLADVFDRVQGVYQFKEAAPGLYYLLDLALEKIPAESGSAFSCELITGALRFVAVRGPKARDILASNVVIHSGQGIVGFCAVEGVSLALSDVHRDRRWYSGVDDRTHYLTQSLLCSPMVSGGRTYGCLELVNRKPTSTFTDHEVGLLSYIAHQGALYLAGLG
jgi:hypothetical protein